MFDNVFTAKILEMWDKKDFTLPPPPHAGVLPPIEPVSQWTVPRKNQTGWGGVGGRGLRTYFFENPLGFLDFCFIPKFQTK